MNTNVRGKVRQASAGPIKDGYPSSGPRGIWSPNRQDCASTPGFSTVEEASWWPGWKPGVGSRENKRRGNERWGLIIFSRILMQKWVKKWGSSGKRKSWDQDKMEDGENNGTTVCSWRVERVEITLEMDGRLSWMFELGYWRQRAGNHSWDGEEPGHYLEFTERWPVEEEMIWLQSEGSS